MFFADVSITNCKLIVLGFVEPFERCGFIGSSTFSLRKSGAESCPEVLPVQLFSSHITMTYAALVTLLTLGDNLERVDRIATLKGVAALQNPDGRLETTELAMIRRQERQEPGIF